jgi:hypothetical protein
MVGSVSNRTHYGLVGVFEARTQRRYGTSRPKEESTAVI